MLSNFNSDQIFYSALFLSFAIFSFNRGSSPRDRFFLSSNGLFFGIFLLFLKAAIAFALNFIEPHIFFGNESERTKIHKSFASLKKVSFSDRCCFKIIETVKYMFD